MWRQMNISAKTITITIKPTKSNLYALSYYNKECCVQGGRTDVQVSDEIPETTSACGICCAFVLQKIFVYGKHCKCLMLKHTTAGSFYMVFCKNCPSKVTESYLAYFVKLMYS